MTRCRISKKIYPNGAEESYHYDALNRLEQVVLPNGGEIFYAYDLDGNCIAQTDAEGNKTEFIYDERNRLIKTISPTGAVTAYEYNQEGRLSCIKMQWGRATPTIMMRWDSLSVKPLYQGIRPVMNTM